MVRIVASDFKTIPTATHLVWSPALTRSGNRLKAGLRTSIGLSRTRGGFICFFKLYAAA